MLEALVIAWIVVAFWGNEKQLRQNKMFWITFGPIGHFVLWQPFRKRADPPDNR
jgi:hypothetical protein